MTFFRLPAALFGAMMLSSCQMANTLMQAPANLLSSVGRAIHVDNDRTPGDASIQAVEAKQARDQLAMREAGVKTPEAVAAPEVAVR